MFASIIVAILNLYTCVLSCELCIGENTNTLRKSFILCVYASIYITMIIISFHDNTASLAANVVLLTYSIMMY